MWFDQLYAYVHANKKYPLSMIWITTDINQHSQNLTNTTS